MTEDLRTAIFKRQVFAVKPIGKLSFLYEISQRLNSDQNLIDELLFRDESIGGRQRLILQAMTELNFPIFTEELDKLNGVQLSTAYKFIISNSKWSILSNDLYKLISDLQQIPDDKMSTEEKESELLRLLNQAPFVTIQTLADIAYTTYKTLLMTEQNGLDEAWLTDLFHKFIWPIPTIKREMFASPEEQKEVAAQISEECKSDLKVTHFILTFMRKLVRMNVIEYDL